MTRSEATAAAKQQTPATAADRLLDWLRDVRYFEVRDLTAVRNRLRAIEAEARQQERDERLNHEFVPCECVDLMGNRTHCLFCGATHAKYILDGDVGAPAEQAPEAQK